MATPAGPSLFPFRPHLRGSKGKAMDTAPQFLLDESGHAAPAAPAAPDDTELLDAYSQAVVAAAERVGPAVVHLEVGLGAKLRRGPRAGFAVSPHRLLLTHNHVVHWGRRIQAN